MTTLVGVSQRGWSGQMKYETRQIKFLVFLFLLSSPRTQVAFLDRFGRLIYASKYVFPVKEVPFGVSTISDYI